jgi:hypothetical protein
MRYTALSCTLLLIATSWIPTIAAQSGNCQPDLTSATAWLNDAQTALNNDDLNTAMTAIADARNSLELIEANCTDYAPETAGDSRTNPVSFGQQHHTEISDYFIGSLQITRYGDNANELVAATDDDNPPPEEGKRYILVEFTIYCEREPSQSCEFRQLNWHIVGSKGIAYERARGIDGFSGEQELFGGAQLPVALVYQVDVAETNFVLFNEHRDTRVFFDLE